MVEIGHFGDARLAPKKTGRADFSAAKSGEGSVVARAGQPPRLYRVPPGNTLVLEHLYFHFHLPRTQDRVPFKIDPIDILLVAARLPGASHTLSREPKVEVKGHHLPGVEPSAVVR